MLSHELIAVCAGCLLLGIALGRIWGSIRAANVGKKDTAPVPARFGCGRDMQGVPHGETVEVCGAVWHIM